MKNLSDVPDRVTGAVLAFLNAGGVDQLKSLILAHRDDLLTDAADRVIVHLIEKHRDCEQDLSHIRGRRALLLECREQGIEETFAPEPRPPESDEVALTFINTQDAGDLMRFVEEHEHEVLSEETDRVIRQLSRLYRDDERVQEVLRGKRDLLESCRQHGIAQAFSKDVLTVSEDLMVAVDKFLTAGPIEDVRHVLQTDRTLLFTDEAENCLAFMAEAADSAGDSRARHMRLRLDLLHRCRSSGIDAALDLRAIEGVLGAAPGEAANGAAETSAEAELDEELHKLVGACGSVSENDLRALVTRRPELKTAIRNRLHQGAISWVPAADRGGIEELLRAMKVAESSGAWFELIPIATEALRRVTRQSAPEIWAMLQFSLGTALSRIPHGDRAENLDRAIGHHESARNVFKSAGRDEDRQMWATNEHHLALAYFQRVRGDHGENVEKAISIWRDLIATVPPETAPLEWAYSLGDALRQRPTGNRSQNLEEAIARLQATVAAADDRGDAFAGPQTRIALGLAYIGRVQGDPADNAERGIEYVTRGLRECSFEGDPTSAANVRRSLAHAYQNRKLGDPAANRRTAVDLLQQVASACPRDRFPEQWAENQLAMAALEMDHPDGRTAARAREAIRLMESALEVYTRRDYPARWAKVQANVGYVYSTLFDASEGSGDDFDKAVAHVESAFCVYTRENAPGRWALLRRTLGRLHLRRAELAGPEERPAMAAKAIDHFERALDVATAADDPEERLEVLKSLTALLFRHQQWQKALRRYVEAMRAADQLMDSAYTEAGELIGARSSDWLYGPAAYCSSE